VGAPNEAERADLASEFLPAADPKDVASRTSGFTPADFALAAQRGAQIAFDRAVAGGSPQVSSEDVLAAIALTRASVSPDALDQFAMEAERFSRL
jgi:SpoVK/Ycf46/Vps4 family AAA+-type ATPase